MKPYVICNMCITIGTTTMREFARRNVRLKADVEGDHVVLFCGKVEVDVKVALDKIRRVLGVRRLMLEGGGTFNGAVLHAGLVDEISQVVVPVVDGGRGVTTIFDIPGDRRARRPLRCGSSRIAGCRAG